MAQTDFLVELDTGGAAASGLDFNALRDDIQAELDKMAFRLEQPAPRADRVAPPKGAQGLDVMVHWLMHVAGEPGMVQVYVRSVIFALNEIAAAAHRGIQPSNGETSNGFYIKIKALGKDVALPTAASVIKAIFEDAK